MGAKILGPFFFFSQKLLVTYVFNLFIVPDTVYAIFVGRGKCIAPPSCLVGRQCPLIQPRSCALVVEHRRLMLFRSTKYSKI